MLKKNMFRAVLFLLLTVLMVAWVSTAVIAGGDPTRSLSLTFDDANILSCTLTVKDRHSGTVVEGFNNKPIVSGEVYQISVGNDVTVTVSTGMGYKVTVQDATGDVNVNKNGLSWNLHWDNYTEEFSATLGTTPRTYKVNVLDYDQEGDISYYIADSSKADGWTIDDLNDPNAPFTYTYGDSTELPSVQRTGFIFEGWRVVGGNLSDVRKIDGKYYIQLSGSDEFDVKDEFSVYPILTPIVYDVYRYDFVYDAKNHMNDYLGERLSIAIRGQAPMDSKITGLYLMDDDLNGIHKTYPGYLVMGAEEYDYEPGKIVNKPWGEGVDNNPNIVNRVYRAIVYDLVFMDDSGNPLAGYEGKTYTYADPTDIADPTRTGYTFIGWKVEIYKNGTWVVVDPDANASNGTLTSPGLSLGIHKAILNEETGERNDPNAIYASEKNPEGKYEIRLTANWTPNVYDIEYDWNVGGNADLEAALEALNPSLPAQFTFDSKNAAGEKKLAIANAIRNGYTFEGWLLWHLDEEGNPVETTPIDVGVDFSLDTSDTNNACDVRLVAKWTARTYSVSLNAGDGVAEGYTPSISQVTFDKALEMPNDFVCPQKVGFTFLGYFSV
ncbi:MAG: InlB B-repeat-containing protein, partial [Clostridia bacterium]|nr:InlB B-repeat-containing protein [Clostridia bacterium]